MNGHAARKPRPAEPMRKAVERLERELVIGALRKAAGQQSVAARSLGISERVLRYKMKKYRIVRSTKVSIIDKSV